MLALLNLKSKQINVNPSLGLCHFSKLKATGKSFGSLITYRRPQSGPWKSYLTKKLVGSSLSVEVIFQTESRVSFCQLLFSRYSKVYWGSNLSGSCRNSIINYY
jgi:hypothetical protein